MTDLPDSWDRSTIGEVMADGIFVDGDWVETKDQDPDGDIRLIQLADVGIGKFRDRSDRRLTRESATRLQCTELREGDVLVARMPEPLGRACLVPRLPTPAVTVVDVCVLRPGPDGLEPAWLMWALNAPQIRSQVAALQSGSTRKRISRKNLSTVRLAVPPKAEQQRIVAAIEEYLSRLDAATDALRAASSKLRRFGLAAVSVALRGDWPIVTLADHTIDQRYGSSAKASRQGEVPILRMGNIKNGRLDFSDLKYLPADHPDLATCALEPGDLIFNRTNSPEQVGKSAVYEGSETDVAIASYLIRVRLDEDLDPRWAATVINSPFGRRYIAGVRSQQVGQANVNGTKLKHFPIPLPSIDVQLARVEQLARARSWLTIVEGEIGRALARAAALRSSILAAAFSGRLVHQDPSEEPASVLLDRIREERRSSASPSVRRKAAATA